MTGTLTLDVVNDPQRTSWGAVANRKDAECPIQNLPATVFRSRNTSMYIQRIDVAHVVADGNMRPADVVTSPVRDIEHPVPA